MSSPALAATWSQQAYLKASNTDAGDCFGSARCQFPVTRSWSERWGSQQRHRRERGTGEADNSASQAGAAYIFTRSGTAWSQQAYLKASNTDAKDYFGMACRSPAIRSWSGRLGSQQ